MVNLVMIAGSTRFTLWQLGLLGFANLLYYQDVPYGEVLLIASLTLALVNLVSAIKTQTLLRRNKALLMFHVSLAAMVILAGIGQLTYLKGRLELTQGTVFSGELIESEQGMFHRNALNKLRFENLGYQVNYREGLNRNNTINQVAWIDPGGKPHVSEIGDQFPLILNGYRFYTSFNKGFSLVFTWQGITGPVTGNVNLPSFPAREFEQAQYWQIPGTNKMIWSQLVPAKRIVTPEQSFVLGELTDHHVVVRFDDERFEMRPGEKVRLLEGTLHYEGVRQWMGYKVSYDWTRPWMIASCLIAIIAMMFYFIDKFLSSPLRISDP
jgi:hypothetical protein